MRNIVKDYKYTDTYIDGELLYPIPDMQGYFITKKLEFYSIRNSRTKILFRKLTPNLANIGYYVLMLGGKTTPRQYLVHRLIAITFIPNPENKPFINHIDGNKLNNNIDNLEWCTASENCQHAHKIGLNYTPKIKMGKDYPCPFQKKVYQYSLDGTLLNSFTSTREIERKLNFDHGGIAKCCRGELKTAYGYKWTY